MQTQDLQRLIDHYAKIDEQKLAQLAFRPGARPFTIKGTTPVEIEEARHEAGGVFGARRGRRYKLHNGLWQHEIVSDWEHSRNIVTNQGLAYVMNVAFDNVADIDTWYVVLFTNDYTPVAGDTYASNGWTEAGGANLDETVRQAWVEGDVSGTTTASISNSASPAVYTGDNTFTAYGAILLGGGAAATTLTDEAGGGTAYSGSRFAASKAMTVDDTIEVTYTVNATDDGV